MAQTILSPDDDAEAEFVVQGPLAENELVLGKVIDLDRLLPGDLILVSSLAPDYIVRCIRKVQERGGYTPEHSRWDHAALYVGKGVICEATKNGVRRARLSKYVGRHLIRARRAAGLTLESRYELAIHALTLHGFSYDFREVFRLWRAARHGFNNAIHDSSVLGNPYPKRATICSQLYADCYVSVTKVVIGNLDGGETTPAWLSVTPQLVDVQLRWLGIPKC